MKKKFFVFLALISMSVLGVGAQAQTVASGTTGGCTWTVSGEGSNLTLRISGSGAMGDYNSSTEVPWAQHVRTLVIEQGVRTIGDYAFGFFTDLTSVSIPASVTAIGEGAFVSCTGLTSITIPNSVVAIGNNAFGYCTGLTSVAIPNSVTAIGEGAFVSCTGLTSIAIGSSVATISANAFGYCTSLSSVTIPSSVAVIGEMAFYACSRLTSVDIPNSVTTIGRFAFGFCEGLSSVTIPDSATEIGAGAFYACTGLTSITNHCVVPQDITYNARFGGVDLSRLTLHVPTGSVGAYLSAPVWQDFGSVGSIGGEEIVASGTTGQCAWVLTGTSGDYTLTISGSGAMADYSSSLEETPWHSYREDIKTLVIGQGVSVIGGLAFRYCTGLTSVTVPNSVTTIGYGAFEYCSGLTSVDLGNSVTTIGNIAFHSCTSLTSVIIPNSVTTIGDATFWLCSGLTSVVIGNSVTTIGASAFDSCSGLTSITIPNSVTVIRSGAFGRCSGLTSVVIPNSVTMIDEHVFDSCTSLTSVVIPNSVTTIGYSAFSNCTSLPSIVIPNSVTTSGGGAFSHCTGLPSIVIPNSVTTIGHSAFSNCTSLPSIVIPNSVTTIGNYAFSSCTGLTSVTISNSTTTIGMGAFSNCTGLTSVTNLSTTPQGIPSDVFAGVDLSKATLCVPAGSVGAYLATPVWQNFKSIVNIGGGSGDDGIVAAGLVGECTWTITGTSDNYTLTIGGAGAMEFYSSTVPWYSFREGIKAVVIGQGVTAIGDGPFSPFGPFFDCSGLAFIDVDEANTAYSSENGVLFNKDRTTLVRYPEGKVGSYAIPASVATIGKRAFYSCRSLTSVVIPNSVATIGEGAFASCSSLTSVTNLSTTPQGITGDVFAGTDLSKVALYVPAGSVGAYRAAPIWQDFGLVGAYDDENIQVDPSSDAVTISWTPVEDAVTYVLVVYGDAARTEEIARFNLDVNGQVVLRSGVEELSVTVSNLTAGWSYYYALTSYDSADEVLTASAGEFATSASTGLGDWEDAGVTVFPNPFTDAVRITGAAGSRLTVVGMDGAQVHEQLVAGADEWISLGHLPAGGYLLRVEKDGMVKTVKVLKRR
jgi:hypothetical protein